MYHVLTNLEIITYNLFHYISYNIQKITSDDSLKFENKQKIFVNCNFTIYF